MTSPVSSDRRIRSFAAESFLVVARDYTLSRPWHAARDHNRSTSKPPIVAIVYAVIFLAVYPTRNKVANQYLEVDFVRHPFERLLLVGKKIWDSSLKGLAT